MAQTTLFLLAFLAALATADVVLTDRLFCPQLDDASLECHSFGGYIDMGNSTLMVTSAVLRDVGTGEDTGDLLVIFTKSANATGSPPAWRVHHSIAFQRAVVGSLMTYGFNKADATELVYCVSDKSLRPTRLPVCVVMKLDASGEWQNTTTVSPSQAVPSFGSLVVLSGSRLAIISRLGLHTYVRSGSDFVPSGSFLSASPSKFGFNMDLCEEGDDLAYSSIDDGMMYILKFTGKTWKVVASFSNPDGNPDHRFGTSLGVTHGLVAVGSVRGVANYTGAVYLYSRVKGKWTMLGSITGDTDDVEMNYGYPLFIRNGILLVGTMSFTKPGAAFIHKIGETEWPLMQTLHMPQDLATTPPDGFGRHLAAAEGISFVVSACQWDTEKGVVLVFEQQAGTDPLLSAAW
mmetsp:Transcript_16946/g.43273  ORF Transcript_16946/g.43273 Transcript_16946/m.43273 type:complete len:404 (+) Transcript_16946:62-1273(+)